MVAVRWPKWPPRPYMVKTFKNLLLQNRECLGAEPLQESSGTGDLPKLLKELSTLTFDLFTVRSSLLPYAFVWEKPLKIFSKTEHALWLNLLQISSGTGGLPKLLKQWPYIDIWPFYGKVNFASLCICMGKMFRISNNFSSGASGPILLKFHMEPP